MKNIKLNTHAGLSLCLAAYVLLFASCQESTEVTDQDVANTQSVAKGELLEAPQDTLPTVIAFNSIPTGLDPSFAVPADNSLSDEKVALGRKLFFDTRLSKDNTVSCATCHRPDHGFASDQAISVGVEGKLGTRNAPGLFNRAYGKAFFWDGRSESLEDQSLQPIVNENEMGNTLENVFAMIEEDEEYPELFEAAFPVESQNSDTQATDKPAVDQFVNKINFAKALASFQRTLMLADSPVDRFQAGTGTGADLNKIEKQGLWIFESRGKCWQCHSGPNYTDEGFHNTGIAFRSKSDEMDWGLFDSTGLEEDKGRFKTPSLRGVDLTPPYMHDGSISNLREVVEFYNQGGSRKDQRLSEKIKPLNLSEDDIDNLVAFLKALSRRGQDSPAIN